MASNTHKSLEEILEKAGTLPPEDQLRFIRSACETDEAMYQQAVRRLISSGWSGEQESEETQSEATAASVAAGERFGPYRIVRRLGAGGMGEVYLAERDDDQFRQQVAIKLVRQGLLSKHVRGRLRLERQILATLDHPNIARLFDGGSTPDGTPFIVMEYVDGESIDTYCDRRAVSVQARLELFRTVCSAVHRAHQNLVVHRDLKPSNILVTAEGIPKLLDFGIAKVLDERQMMHTLAVTGMDYRVMTPDHASPEQIRGEPITTASDIYVLGVVLYELLSGLKPFVIKANRLADLERTICEEPPAAPSSAIAASTQSAPSEMQALAAKRGVTPARLRRELSGDLDNIVLMAMRKEPERRYLSVEQFAADIERYLSGLPVLARADAWAYRTGKFLRRHTVVAGLSAAFLISLIGFSVSTYVQSKQVQRERDMANVERERAEAVSDFLIESFSLADPAKARGKEITAREILDSGATRIAKELQMQPALQATLLDTIGTVYLSLGLPSDAQPLIERGLSMRREIFGEEHRETAQSLNSLNRVYADKGDLDAAERLARQSLDINRKLTGPNSTETADSLCQLGAISREKGLRTAAEQLFRQCLDIRIARLGREHEQITAPLDSLARLAQDRQDFDSAIRLYREAMLIDRRARGEDHPIYLRHLHNLATAIHEKGDLETAEPLYRQAVAQCQRVFGPNHPETIDVMSNFGRFLMDQGRLDEARSTYEAVLAADMKARGARHAYVGHDLASLGSLALRRGEFALAEKHYREALDIYRERLPPGHGYTAGALNMLGRVLVAAGRPREAEAILSQALTEWTIEYGRQSPGYATANATMGHVLTLQGQLAQAERALIESYPIIASSERRADREIATLARGWIQDLYKAQNRPEAARAYFAEHGN